MAAVSYSINHGLQELASVASTPRMGLRSQVHEVVGIVVSLAQYFGLGVVEQWQKFVVVTLSSFGRELEVEPPHTASEQSCTITR